MKLHLPVQLFRAVIALMAVVFPLLSEAAEIPNGYTTVNATNTSDVTSKYNNSDDYAFLLKNDLTFDLTYSSNRLMYSSAGSRLFTSADSTNRSSITICNGKTQAILGKSGSSITFTDLEELNVINNNGDEIIYSQGPIIINKIESIIFRENSTTSTSRAVYGGGIYCYYDPISINNNGTITFYKNQGEDGGGAIYCSGSYNVTINNNKGITFNENYSQRGSGGAIYAGGNFYMNNNADITINKNYTFGEHSSSCGGGIYSGKALSMSENLNIEFIGNYIEGTISYYQDCYGGALYSGTTTTLSNNQNITFTDNSAYDYYYAQGGAIYGGSTIEITNNNDVAFKGNKAYSSGAASSEYYTRGGAICGKSGVNINNNKDVSFTSNYTSGAEYNICGGGIYGSAITINNNENVLFNGNAGRCKFFSVKSLSLWQNTFAS